MAGDRAPVVQDPTPGSRWSLGETTSALGLSLIGGYPVEAPAGFEHIPDAELGDGDRVPAAPKEGAPHFYAFDPSKGTSLPRPFYAATIAEVDEACEAAWRAFFDALDRPPTDRALLLGAIATRVEQIRKPLVATVERETGLSERRITAELARTIGTLRMFARLVEDGSWVRASIDHGDPARQPVPRPDLHRVLRPLGPVAVFGASNFPLAYSTAGGDTASALAAGCPVIVKGHPLHPGTGELVAQAVCAAVEDAGLDAGMFAFLHAGGQREHAIGEQLVRHPCVRAVGFTGSLSGGRSLAELAATRHDPIPAFCEMGSVNPVFVLPNAMRFRPDLPDQIGGAILASAGQQCTCPGLIFVTAGDGFEAFRERLAAPFARSEPLVMLAPRIQQRYAARVHTVEQLQNVTLVAGPPPVRPHPGQSVSVPTPVKGSPALFAADFPTFSRTMSLHEEIFGPAAVLVVCEDGEQLAQAAGLLMGTLTASIYSGDDDEPLRRVLTRVLELRAGRVIFNGVPTGVEVYDAMVHGGPYPATNHPHVTAVGPRSIERWCRPVCYQNAPDEELPRELAARNDLGIRRDEDATPRKDPLGPGAG